MEVLIIIGLLGGAFMCYAACIVAGRADRASEAYWEKYNSENLKK